MGIPSITHEQTVVAGFANKLIAKFARKVAVTWPSSLSHYPNAVLTGLPLRPELLGIKNYKNKKIIYITGGKNGSHIMNEIVFKSLSELTNNYKVIHQTGFADLPKAESIKNKNYECFAYDSQKAMTALSRASLVISRSGAHITYELGLLRIRCVLIPIPWVSHNEQLKNAEILAKSDLAIILPEKNLNSESLLDSIQRALKLNHQPQNFPDDGLDRLVSLIKTEFS